MYSMNSRQLQYVIAVAEAGSISAAAQKLYISQPSLSQYIQKIESELGIELFERTNPLRLTTAGHVYVNTARTILLEQAELEKVIGDIKDYKYGSLTIGTTPYCAAWVLPPVVAEFNRRLPHIQLVIREGIEKELPARAASGEFDFVVSSMPLVDKETVSSALMMEPFILAVPQPLTAHPDYPHIENSEQHPFVDIKRFEALPFISMDSGFYLDMLVKHILKSRSTTPKIIARCASMTTIYTLLKNGVGISILPACMSKSFSDDILYFRLQDVDERRPVNISYRQTQYLSKAAQNFIDVFSEVWSSIS